MPSGSLDYKDRLQALASLTSMDGPEVSPSGSLIPGLQRARQGHLWTPSSGVFVHTRQAGPASRAGAGTPAAARPRHTSPSTSCSPEGSHEGAGSLRVSAVLAVPLCVSHTVSRPSL